MKEFLKKSWKYFLALIIGIIFGILINIPSCTSPQTQIEYIPVHDTITVEKERIIEHTKTLFITDTLLKVDSIYVEKDGTYVELPMKWNQYKDTIKNDSSEAYIEIDYHGIVSEIDRVYLDYKYNKEIQTVIKEPKRVNFVWFVGLSGGYGIHGSMNNGTFGHGPEVGIHAGIGIGGIIK